MVGWKSPTSSTGLTELHVFDEGNTVSRTNLPCALWNIFLSVNRFAILYSDVEM